MTEEVQKMFTELLAQRLGVPAGDLANAGGDSVMAAVALSLMQRSRSKHGGNASIRRIASIVGACPGCLGDDPACIHCAGQGQPGYRRPDDAAFLEWIAAPLERLGLCVSAHSEPSREHNHVGGNSQ